MLNKYHLGDCVEVMKNIPDSSIDLVCIDPPYNIGIADWDKVGKAKYEEFIKQVLTEISRVIKPLGSLYLFHNDFIKMVSIQNIINETKCFYFNQLIVWNKKYEGYWNQLNATTSGESKRNYSKQAEYILFYVASSDEVAKMKSLVKIQNYFSSSIPKEDYAKIAKMLNVTVTNVRHWINYPTQPSIPSRSSYLLLQKEYPKLSLSYDDLKKWHDTSIFEDRYLFNNLGTHHSVWNYPIPKNIGHPTIKPIELVETIIKHSSRENDVVLDCFGGSGTTAEACIRTKRNYILIDNNIEYVELGNKRIEQALLEVEKI